MDRFIEQFEQWKQDKTNAEIEAALSEIVQADVELVYQQCECAFNLDTCKNALALENGDLVNAIMNLSM